VRLSVVRGFEDVVLLEGVEEVASRLSAVVRRVKRTWDDVVRKVVPVET
jgi:hypothetical protein